MRRQLETGREGAFRLGRWALSVQHTRPDDRTASASPWADRRGAYCCAVDKLHSI